MKLASRTLALLLAATAIGAAVFHLVNAVPPMRRQDLPAGDRSHHAVEIRREEAATLLGLLPFTVKMAQIGVIALIARKLGVSINGRMHRNSRRQPPSRR